MSSLSKKGLAIAVGGTSLVSAAGFGLFLLSSFFQWPAGQAASLVGMAGLVVICSVLISRLAYAPLRRTREQIQALSLGSFRDRLYIENVEEETGRIKVELNALMDRMEETLAKQRQFVGAVSHDIRTPLTIIKGDIEVALMRSREREEYEDILSSNLEEVDRIHRMVDDLVTLSRADYGSMGLNIRMVALGSLAAEVRTSFEEAAKRKGIFIETYLEGDIHIEGDSARLRQLLHNLLDNAVHYTPSGGRIELALVSDQERDQAQIRVKDTGVGISALDLPHIFEPFYRGNPSRRTRHDGYGLGLSICDHIITAHGGRISVESKEGQDSGTTFIVHFPKRSHPAVAQVG